MARVPRQPKPTTARPRLATFVFLLLAVAGFCAVMVSASSSASSPQQPQAVANADDLICHTDVAAECYPRIFEATHEFQPLHADQEVPPGLHIRLNIYTGEREAKINDQSDELSAGEMPVQMGLAVVDQPEDGDEVPAALPKGAPKFDPVGAVKKPSGSVGGDSDGKGGDGVVGDLTFPEVVAVIKDLSLDQADAAERARFADALEQLAEFAHDIYYGLRLTEDAEATGKLLGLMSGCSSSRDSNASKTSNAGNANNANNDDLVAAQRAAAIIGAATQNNPAALRQIAKRWDAYKAGVCVAPGREATTLGEVVFGPYHDDSSDSSSTAFLAWARSRLLAINGLIKNDVIMKDFLARDGLTELLRLLVEQDGNQAYDLVRTRAANLVSDNFLDAGMGADVSLWPASATAGAAESEVAEGDAAVCGADGQVHGHCWHHHVEQLADTHQNDDAHWAHDMRQRLRARGPVHRATTAGRDEL